MEIKTKDIANICKSLFPYHELIKINDEFLLYPKMVSASNPAISFHREDMGWVFRFQFNRDSLRYDHFPARQCWSLEDSKMDIDLVSSVGKQIETLATLLSDLILDYIYD